MTTHENDWRLPPLYEEQGNNQEVVDNDGRLVASTKSMAMMAAHDVADGRYAAPTKRRRQWQLAQETMALVEIHGDYLSAWRLGGRNRRLAASLHEEMARKKRATVTEGSPHQQRDGNKDNGDDGSAWKWWKVLSIEQRRRSGDLEEEDNGRMTRTANGKGPCHAKAIERRRCWRMAMVTKMVTSTTINKQYT